MTSATFLGSFIRSCYFKFDSNGSIECSSDASTDASKYSKLIMFGDIFNFDICIDGLSYMLFVVVFFNDTVAGFH